MTAFSQSPLKRLVTLIAVAALGTMSSQATIYVWQGVDNDLDDPANWTYDGGLDSGDPATPITSGNQIDTFARSEDIIRFEGSYSKPQNIYTRTGTTWGSIEVLDGTITWQNDGNNQGNYSFSDAASNNTPTLVVGDGDATAAVAQLNITQWNEGGGDKTYVIYSDGTLSSARGGNHDWSNGTNDTVMRLLGGTVSINGAFDEADLLSDANDYVSFEDFGSTFTFNKGSAGWFDDSSDVTNGFDANGGGAFVLGGSLNSGNAALQLTDNGSTWTISVIAVPEPSSFALMGLGGLLLGVRRRR